LRPRDVALADVLAAVSSQLPVRPDGWAPTVQGAVGHVVGVQGSDGSGYVVKTYPGDAGVARAATELVALKRFREVPGVPVPQVVLSGRIDRPELVTYVVLSRLPGVRWADRRSGMPAHWRSTLTAEVGRLLRRLHHLPGDRFGSAFPGGPSWATAWKCVDALCDDLLRQDLLADGSAALALRVRRLVDRSRASFTDSVTPVLCHNDFNGGNVLVASSGVPTICGVVDLERAAWADPLYDLAKTRRHVRHHDPAGPDVLMRAYGVEGEGDRRRVDVYEVLHAMAERTWIMFDRPAAWSSSVAALESYVWQQT
jgi:aminoglycoside phosphotransferase (APT) family kinase protein